MTLKQSLLLVSLILTSNLFAQEKQPSDIFWETLTSHCGKAYKGHLALPENDEAFGGKELVMHVRSCSDNEIKVPFFVGEDRSRTWVFTKKDGIITLKHDHRHEDGSEDAVTQYGGTASNVGKEDIQFFPADPHTQQLIPAAATNVWWVTLDETSFTYNLRRLGRDSVFKVVMDITKPIATPEAPWGWKD